MDESLFRAHFERVIQHHKKFMIETSARGDRTIPTWLFLFNEKFHTTVMPIVVTEDIDTPRLVRKIIDTTRPDAFILVTEAWNKRKIPEGMEIGNEIPYKSELELLPKDQWKEMVMFLGKIRDDRTIVVSKAFTIKRKVHNDDNTPIESFEEMHYTGIRARELYFGA